MQNQKPMHTSSLVSVFANETIPPAFSAKLLAENRSAFGMIVREPGQLVIEKFGKDDIADSEKTAKLLQDILDNTKKFPVMFTFHSFLDGEFDEDEIQPFTIIRDSKKNPILSIGVEGDFPNYGGDPEGFSEAFKFVNDWLGPKIEEIYQLGGNNPAKLSDYLKGPQFRKDFEAQIGHRASIHFMPSTGEPFIVEKNDIGVNATWGSASLAYGYTEPVAAAAPAPKKEATMPKSSKYSSPDPEPQPQQPPTKVEPVPGAPANNPPPVPANGDVVGKVANDIEERDWMPPAGLHGKPLKEAYRKVNNNVLPSNWKDRPTIRIKIEKVVKSMADIDKTKAAQNVIQSSKTSTTFVLPVIGGPEIKAANEFIKKYVGDGSALITDPNKSQFEEEKVPTFTQLVTQIKDIRNLGRWKPSALFALNKEHPHLTVFALMQALHTLGEVDKVAGQVKLGEQTGTSGTTENGKPPVELPETGPSTTEVPQPEEAPRRTSKYA